jgi:hypothetical protein
MKRKLFWTFAIIFAAGMLATIRVSAPAASRRRRLAEVSLVRCPPAERSRCRRGRPQSGTFRATEITAYLSNGGTLEHAQEMAAHESPRTTKLYDRTKERLTQDEVERIRL